MNRLVVGAGLMLGLGLGQGQLAAQDQYRGPSCELDQGHFLVRAAKTYIQGATEEADPAKREELLMSAYRNLVDGIDSDQGDNPAIWYFLGRYYYMTDDGTGADSAFTRVLQLAPDCTDDIAYYRESMWVQAVNRGIDSLQNGALEGAKEEFRSANALLLTSNVALFYLGGVFANEAESDSALHYFKQVADMGLADAEHLENYHTAVENVATLYHMLGEWDSTIVWFEKVREIDPTNNDALFGMAEAYFNLGDQARTLEIFDLVLADAASMNSLDLFNTGVRLFHVNEFDKAVQAFEAGLEKNRFHRDALFNLANTFMEISQDESRPRAERDAALRQMDEIVHRLFEVDPKNRGTYRILAAAHTLQGLHDSTEVIMDEMESLTYEIAVDISRPMSGGYTAAGRIINLKDTPTDVPSITLEFLDGTGQVVASDTIGGETLGPSESSRFNSTQAGDIVAWRYRVGS